MATKKPDEKPVTGTEKSASQVKSEKSVATTKQTTQTKPVKTETAKSDLKGLEKSATVKTTSAPQKSAQVVKKPTPKKYHVAQRNDDGLWQVKAEGAEKALKLFKTQQEAIDYAKKVADNQEGSIMIHKKDGSFRKLSY